MNKKDMTLLKELFTSSEKDLWNSLKNIAFKIYKKENIYQGKEYILAKGNIPVCLAAHVDTIFPTVAENIYFDQEAQVMWSPEGLGADDRVGIFLILKLIKMGLRPHIIFTLGEETGGTGSKQLITELPQAPFDIKYIIQLDRRGEADCVFYDCENPQFETYISSFGFIKNYGTFSDISHICPVWKIAGVNLSVGYFNEHTYSEILKTNVMYRTLNCVIQMLKDASKANKFDYIPKQYNFNFLKNNKCDCCKTFHAAEEIFAVIDEKGNSKNYCIECMYKIEEKLNYCQECDNFYISSVSNPQPVCFNCYQKEKIEV